MAIEKTVNIDVDSKDAEKGFDKLADAIKQLNDTFSKFQKTTEDGLEEINETSKKTEKGVGGIAKGFKGPQIREALNTEKFTAIQHVLT